MKTSSKIAIAAAAVGAWLLAKKKNAISGVEGVGKLDARLKTHRGQIKDEINKTLERVGDRVWNIRNGDISTQIIELAYYASNGDMKYARETQDEFMNLLYDAYVTINKARSLANKI